MRPRPFAAADERGGRKALRGVQARMRLRPFAAADGRRLPDTAATVLARMRPRLFAAADPGNNRTCKGDIQARMRPRLFAAADGPPSTRSDCGSSLRFATAGLRGAPWCTSGCSCGCCSWSSTLQFSRIYSCSECFLGDLLPPDLSLCPAAARSAPLDHSSSALVGQATVAFSTLLATSAFPLGAVAPTRLWPDRRTRPGSRLGPVSMP